MPLPATLSDKARAMLTLIDGDMTSGQIPRTVRSFSELHDHVDANVYFEDVGCPDPDGTQEQIEATIAADNAISDEVTAVLASGLLDTPLDVLH